MGNYVPASYRGRRPARYPDCRSCQPDVTVLADDTRTADCPCRCTVSDDEVVGMAYVPVQKWGTPYDPERGFARGTLFPALDKPFKGGCCV